MESSFIEKDITRYERVHDRALAVGMIDYARAVTEVLVAMRKLAELDNVGVKQWS